MSTLDMPQRAFMCRECGKPSRTFVCSEHPEAGMRAETTLLYADFASYMDSLRVQHGEDVPSDRDVWDLLESRADVAPSNREAIDNAIRAVVSER